MPSQQIENLTMVDLEKKFAFLEAERLHGIRIDGSPRIIEPSCTLAAGRARPLIAHRHLILRISKVSLQSEVSLGILEFSMNGECLAVYRFDGADPRLLTPLDLAQRVPRGG